MREAKLIETRDVALDEIRTSDRLRRASPSAVASIVASIEQLGTALAPVMVRRKGGNLILIGGLHRMEAYRELGRDRIRADIWECSDDWARLAEIDENLAGADLSTLELASFLARRKELYEKLNPEAKHGGDRRSAAFDDQTEIVSFCSTIAEKRGMSDRHVRNLVRIGRNLDIQARVLLGGHERETGRHVGYGELAAMATLKSHEQADAVKWFLEAPGERRLKAAVVRAAGGDAVPKEARLERQKVAGKIAGLLGRLSREERIRVLRDVAFTYEREMRAAIDAPGEDEE